MDRSDLSAPPHVEPPRGRASVPHRAVLATALLLGVMSDIVIRGPQGPGLNILLFFIGLALAVLVACRAAGRPPSREARWWMIAGVLFASGFVLRASEALQALAFLLAAAAFAFPALRAGAAWMRDGGVSEQIEAVVGAMAYSGLGAFRLAADGLSRRSAPEEAGGADPGRFSAVLRGLLMATPLLLVFGALFMSADRVFARLVTDLLGVAVDEWASHIVLTGIFTWLAAGYLTGFLTGTGVRGLVGNRVPRPSIGIVEAGIALALVDLLFAAFVLVQLRYLFGGSGLVEVTPGLTYAEYAREGFAQLALASALVLPSLLAADWLLFRPSRRDRMIFIVLGGLQILLLLVVILSAFQRVDAYQAAYGLTESRLYGAAFLGWLVLLSGWFGVTVLRGRRERFALPALLSVLALVVLLFVANPDAWIARTNLQRAGLAEGASPTPPSTASGVDVSYLGSLSADAVPALMRALPRLDPDARCHLADRLLRRWGPERDLDWRSWNRSVARARGAVRTEAAELRSMIGPESGCPEPSAQP